MPDLPAMMQQAITLHRAGKLSEAAQAYDQILRYAPTHPDTLHLRGFVAYQLGHDRDAKRFIRSAIAQNPNNAMYHVHLALAFERAGESEPAIASAKRASQLAPDAVEVALVLGEMHLRRGDWSDAKALLERFAAAPLPAPAWANLSRANLELGLLDDAEQTAARGLAVDAASAECRFHRALALKALGRPEEALSEYQRLWNDRPEFTPCTINFANLLIAAGRTGEAETVYRRSLENLPDDASLHYGLAVLLHDAGRVEDAIEEYSSATTLAPAFAQAWMNLGSACRSVGNIDRAVACARKSTELDATSLPAWRNLGNAVADQGNFDEARRAYLRAAGDGDRWLAELRAEALCPLIYESRDEILEYRARLNATLDRLLDQERRFDLDSLIYWGVEPPFNLPFHGLADRPLKERYARLFIEGFREIATPLTKREGPLRVGVVVTDRNERIFVRSMADLFRHWNLDRGQLVLCCSREGKDRIAPSIGRDDVEYLSMPSQLSEAIPLLRAAKFDLLYFWEIGTDALNYFLPFARLAPVQCTSWGIQVTTGNPEMDYYLSSRWLEPEHATGHYSERLLLLETLLSCQPKRQRPTEAVSRSDFGLSGNGAVYLCAQNLGKFHPDFDPVMKAILERDPTGHIVITGSKSALWNDRLRLRLEESLSDGSDRVVILPTMPPNDYYRLLTVSDVLLDPLPFGGVNTTYDGLSFGIPIVTLPGEFQRGRFTHGCYRRMQLEALAATSIDDYVDKAVAWGTDAELRAQVSRQIADRSDVLFDDAEAARELEQTLFDLAKSSRSG